MMLRAPLRADFTLALLAAFTAARPALAKQPVVASHVPIPVSAATAKAAPQVAPQNIQRLAAMTPEQREQYLANLTPQRRQLLQRKLDEFQKMPPESAVKVETWLQRLRSLPPERQKEVRQSLQQLNALPIERRIQVRREIAALALFPAETRQTKLNGANIRSRFSPEEQQIMGHLTALLPPVQ